MAMAGCKRQAEVWRSSLGLEVELTFCHSHPPPWPHTQAPHSRVGKTPSHRAIWRTIMHLNRQIKTLALSSVWSVSSVIILFTVVREQYPLTVSCLSPHWSLKAVALLSRESVVCTARVQWVPFEWVDEVREGPGGFRELLLLKARVS